MIDISYELLRYSLLYQRFSVSIVCTFGNIPNSSIFATSLFCQFVIPMIVCNILNVAVKMYCK